MTSDGDAQVQPAQELEHFSPRSGGGVHVEDHVL